LSILFFKKNIKFSKNEEIYDIIKNNLKNEDEFKTLGYAFLIGLLNDGNKENQNEGNEQ